MREIKFRAWDNNLRLLINIFTLYNEGTGSVIPQTEQHSATTGNERYVLMQYTGLKDKNGKEIYEGDVCGKVLPYNRDFEIDNTPSQWHSLIEFGSLEDLEVIGNIYENPELLKGDKRTV